MSFSKHATSLTFMHAADVLQPLIILPYAARVLEPFHFGQFAYAMSISQIAATVVGYGFHWTAQREVAAAREDPAEIATLYAEVVSAQALLFLAVTVVGLGAAGNIIAISKPLFLCTMLTAAGTLLFPAWLFIALERAWQAAVGVILSRLIGLVLFVMMVKSTNGILLAVAIQASIPLVAGAIVLPFTANIGFGALKCVTLSRVISQLKSGLRGFLFTLVETSLVALPIPIVTHLAGYTAAGEFSVAAKLVSATRPFFKIISETFLPRVAYYARHSPAKGVVLIRNSMLTLVGGASLGLALYFLGPYVIIYIFGEKFAGAIQIIRIMAVIPVLVNLNVLTSNLYMFSFGHERAWAVLNVTSLFVFLAMSYFLFYLVSNAAIAVAVALIIRECFVLIISATFFAVFGTRKMRSATVPMRSGTQETTTIEDVPSATPIHVALSHSNLSSER